MQILSGKQHCFVLQNKMLIYSPLGTKMIQEYEQESKNLIVGVNLFLLFRQHLTHVYKGIFHTCIVYLRNKS